MNQDKKSPYYGELLVYRNLGFIAAVLMAVSLVVIIFSQDGSDRLAAGVVFTLIAGFAIGWIVGMGQMKTLYSHHEWEKRNNQPEE